MHNVHQWETLQPQLTEQTSQDLYHKLFKMKNDGPWDQTLHVP